MVFGFVVSRCGLSLHVLESSRGRALFEYSSVFLPLGVFLVLPGMMADIFVVRRPFHYVRALNAGLHAATSSSTLAIALSIILAILNIVMAFFLGSSASSRQLLPTTPTSGYIFQQPPYLAHYFLAAHASPSGCFPATIFPSNSSDFRSITTT